MQLVLMRHAIAEERSERWPDDGRRPLTKGGERKHRAVSEELRRMGIAFDEILSSPLVRARQTAEITARVYGWTRPIVEAEELGYRFSFPALAARLERFDRDASILCVGHEPDLSRFGGRLLHASGDVQIEFKKSGVLGLALETGVQPGSATLLWFLKPGHLARIAKGEPAR
ncbi:MAG TPA: phosphohistidine phosphatase SixA [Gemmatimonadota bacterium]|jgi:phosphohistidine phosphatase